MRPVSGRAAQGLSEAAFGALLLLPAALLLALVVVVPIGRLFWLSLHSLRLSEPWAGQPFVGLLNYQDVLADPRFWDALANTASSPPSPCPARCWSGSAWRCSPTSRSAKVAGAARRCSCPGRCRSSSPA